MTKIRVVVQRRSVEATNVVRLDLRAIDNAALLPAFTPGAHIDLFLPNGLTRQYSLLNDSVRSDRYEIAVLNTATSRGGSACVHADLRPGSELDISPPRNNFPLRDDFGHYVFVAGGIGITPILSMIRYCQRHSLSWRLLYLARSRAHAAFLTDLADLGADRVRFHFDDEAGCLYDFRGGDFDFAAGTSIYCCGPQPVMQSVTAFAADRPGTRAYFEWFTPPADGPQEVPDTAFDVKLASADQVLHIPVGRTILEVLEENDVSVPCSCREGMCRTCETRVLAGIPDHRDYVLSNSEQAGGKTMMICVSRSKTSLLVLDL
jgi:tetrachlorobenzoquinone reductase